MQKELRFLLWLMVLCLLACVSHGADAQTTSVTVVVNDVDGNSIKGAKVTVTNPDDKEYGETKVTNKKGKVTFSHSNAEPTYAYEISKKGFQSVTAEARSGYNQTARLEVVLLPEKTGEVSGQELQAALGQSRAYTTFNEGAEAQEKGDLKLAEKKFREAAEISPNLPEPHIALAVVAHQREDFATAAAEAELALAISPSNEQALLLRYDAYRMLGDAENTADAAEGLRSTERVSDAAASVFNEGLEKYKSGNMDEAIVNFQQAVDLDPGLVNGYVMLGSIALSQSDPSRAAAMATKALEIDPRSANALKVRYDALRNLGDDTGSRQALEILIEIDPEWVGTDLYNHAVELYNAGAMDDAAIALAKVVQAHPEDTRAIFLLGMADYNLGDLGNAKKHLGKFLELAPDDPDAAMARELLEFASQ